jgi:DNA-binding GntR family transcriptional regulator
LVTVSNPDTSEPAVRSTAAAVVRAMRRDLVSGAFHPRERLVEADLAARYGAKRSAVRAALIELTGEGLVEREPNRGARVRLVSIDEAVEIVEVRRALESLCAALAAERGTGVQHHQLKRAVEDLQTAAAAADDAAYQAANYAFNSTVREMAGHAIAARFLEHLWNQNLQRHFPLVLIARRRASVHEKEQIAKAIIDGDAQLARQRVELHLTNLIKALRRERGKHSPAMATWS